MSIKRAVERHVGGGYKAEQMSALFWGAAKDASDLNVARDIGHHLAMVVYQQMDDASWHAYYKKGFIEGDLHGVHRGRVAGREEGKREGLERAFPMGLSIGLEATHKPIHLVDLQEAFGSKIYSAASARELAEMVPDQADMRFNMYRASTDYMKGKGKNHPLVGYLDLENNAFALSQSKGPDLLAINFKHLVDPQTGKISGETRFSGMVRLPPIDQHRAPMESLKKQLESSKHQLETAIANLDVYETRRDGARLLINSINRQKETMDKHQWSAEHNKLIKEIAEFDIKVKSAAEEIQKATSDIVKTEKNIETQRAKNYKGAAIKNAEMSANELFNMVLGEPKVIDIQPISKKNIPDRDIEDRAISVVKQIARTIPMSPKKSGKKRHG